MNTCRTCPAWRGKPDDKEGICGRRNAIMYGHITKHDQHCFDHPGVDARLHKSSNNQEKKEVGAS